MNDSESAVPSHPGASATEGQDGEDDGIPAIVRSRSEHGISRRDIDPDALKVLYRLARSNYTAYLVGGGVRDLLLGRKPKDFDVSTDAKPEQIKSMFRNCLLIGRRFRLAHVRFGDKVIETSTFRRSPKMLADPTDPEADLFQRDDNLFGTPGEDAQRRDFTVNGLFYDIETFSVIDYVGGMDDLAARSIRSIGDPNIRFREDPVRMIRAVRFASRLGFEIETETLDAVVRHREEVLKASPARLLEEFTRLFAFSSGEAAMRLMRSTGLLRAILPEVDACLDEDADREALFWRRLAALDKGDTVLPEATPALIFSVVLTDAMDARLSRQGAGRGPRNHFEQIRSFLSPLAERLRFPRKLTDRLIRMFLAQGRLADFRKKQAARLGLAMQDWFQEALALRELDLIARGRALDEVRDWRNLLVEKLYAGDDQNGRRQYHGNRERQPVREAEREREPSAGQAGESPQAAPGELAARPVAGGGGPGQGLSRSARRRRNRQRNRMRNRQGQETGNGAADPLGMEVEAALDIDGGATDAIGSGTAERSESAAGEEAKKPQRTMESGLANGSGNNGNGGGKKGRGRRRASKVAAPESAPEAENRETSKPEKTVLLDNPDESAPIVAASFFVKAAASLRSREAASKAPSTRDGNGSKRSGHSRAAKNSESADLGKSSAPAGRPENDDDPMHWLDEI